LDGPLISTIASEGKEDITPALSESPEGQSPIAIRGGTDTVTVPVLSPYLKCLYVFILTVVRREFQVK
jgi:hypothetical protein